MNTARRKNLRTFFAIHSYSWAVVATLLIINTLQVSPIDHNRLGLWVVVALAGVGVGSLLIRRPRVDL